MPSLRHLLLSGYIAAPEDPAEEDEFFAGLVDLGIGGIEHALPVEGTRSLEPAWVARNLRPEWDVVVSLVPTMMPRLGVAPTYGLGSLDEDQRAHALADVARARDLAVTLAQADGRRRVSAIEVHSAPGPRGGSVEAFSRSLDEILGWDLAGAELLVEHCDAYVPGLTPAKGFWTLEDELVVVRAKGLPADVLGMCVNWGRSVIEGRSTATAVEHTQAVAEAGLLRMLVLSGATGAETPWNPPWSDMHIPPRSDDHPALAASANSLMGLAEITETLKVAGDVPRVGVKVGVRPTDADVATRLAVARASLELVAEARASL
ncbi:DUF4862 family protein [Cellulomonas sp. P5_C5]